MFRIHAHQSLWVWMLVLTTALTSWGAAQAPTRLQVVSTDYSDRANDVAGQIDQLGLGPADILQDGDTYKVRTRAFGSYAEASFVKSKLTDAGLSGAFAVADTVAVNSDSVFADAPSIARSERFTGLQLDFHPKPAPVRQVSLTKDLQSLDNATAAENALFRKVEAHRFGQDNAAGLAAVDAFIARFPESKNVARAKLMRGYWMIRANDLAAAKTQFEGVEANYPTQPEAGEAALRVGYLLIKANAPSGDVLNQFLKVAKGDLPATDEIRCEAMLRCAALYHRGKDLETAEAAYRHIEQFAAGDPEVQAFAKMQQAGITMEKAWNGKASFAQARETCDDLLARFPSVNKQTRATAALMAMETLCYEKTFAPVLERGDAYLAEFNDTPEAPLAYYWIAKARMETGDAAGAAQLLDAVVDADFATAARFKNTDVNPAARRLAAKAQEKLGNTEKAKALRTGE